MSAIPLAKIGEITTRKKPEKGLEQAEKILTQDPNNVQGHKLLASSAMALKLPHTAVFALESIRDRNPEDVENLKQLAKAYLETGQVAESIRTCDRGLKIQPGDGELQEIVKQASVAQSMEKGRWEEESDFRSKLKDVDEATKLEQESRATTSEDNVEKLIQELYEKIQEEPDNLNHYRQIARYYHQLKDYENAISWIQEARKLEAGKADAALERLESRYYREYVNSLIKVKKEELEKDPDNADLRKEVEEMESERDKFLLEEAAELVKKYPNDYEARYSYGELLLKAGETDKAIQQLQNSVRNPKVRLSALFNLGKAYMEKTFYDLAAEQFETAKSEAPQMNDTKKAIIYELGRCYERMDEKEKAMEEYKSIYAADIGFRDVAEKIDTFYKERNK